LHSASGADGTDLGIDLAPGLYQWRVASVVPASGRQGPWGDLQMFRVVLPGPDAAPVQVQPGDVTIRWPALPHATAYDLQVSADGSFAQPLSAEWARPRWARRLAGWAPSSVALLVVALLMVVRPAPVERLDLLAYDVMAPSHPVGAGAAVVVAIDDDSLASIGRWPWPRSVHADVIDALRVAGVSAVALDILFTEGDVSDPQGDSQLAGTHLEQAMALEDDGMAPLEAAVGECLHRAHEVRLAHPLRLAHPDHPGTRLLHASVSPLRDAAKRIEGAVVVLTDVTASVESANRLRHAATHDALTGLPNRVLLQERLALALARAQRLHSMIAVLFLDLDRFKRINDSLGHSHGDEVLRVTARRLAAICRSTDFVVRWGGDEFVVVMEDVPGEAAVTSTAAKLVAALGEDIDVEGMRLACSCSVGIAIAPQDGVEIEALLAKADTAMYRAKSHPDTGFHFYSSELKLRTRERLSLEVELRHALRDGLFELHYQPQYRLGDGALVGFEALLRWWRQPDTLVQPVDFIGVAEESGLIVDIGAWVVQRVTSDMASWLSQGLQAVPVAVNVSARQCVNRNIVDVVRRALQESGIPPALLKLEITETTAMTDAARVIDLLHEIKALGVRIAVDDFGTGYSSLANLKRFPIDELKIDQSFVQDVATDADDAAIVRATIALAHELGIQVIAEGVENRAQSDFLSAQSCDIVQGFLYGRPQPLGQTTPLL
jgi:diguanylate cyclase (GGDEF)-like protein